MASEKVAGVLSTKIKMDTTEASKSMRQLNNDINSTVSILKQQEQEFKSTGDNVNALQTKISRLTETQNGYYEKLKLLKQAQNDVKDRLGESSTEYQKYQTQINKTITTIGRYDDQINKAQKSLQYYDSGLAKLRQSYSEQQRLSQSLVERLRAEGKEWQANQEEIKQSKNAYSNLKQQYEIQENELGQLKTKLNDLNSSYKKAQTELNSIAQSSGKASDAYTEQKQKMNTLKSAISSVNSDLTKQETRLNQTATSMAKAKNNQDKLSDALERSHPNYLAKVREHLKDTDDKTQKLSLSTAKMFAANMLSNGLTSALGALKDKFTDLLHQGNEYLDYEQKMNATWLTLTGNAQKGQDMVNTINQMATASQNSTQMVDGLAKQFYAVTNNKEKTEELSKSVLTLQDAFGASDDAVQNFAQQYSQMVANGKASAQDFLSFTNVFPQMKQQLLEYEKTVTHNTKMTTKDLNQMISDGKISAEDMNKVLIDMGNKYQNATQNFTNTIPGLKRTIDATMPQLVGAIEAPFYNMKNPILGSLSKAITDPAIKTEVGKLSVTIMNAINDVLNAFGGKQFDGTKAIKGILQDLEKSVKTFASTIVTHKKDIKDFLSTMSTASVASWKVFAETLKALLPVIKNVANAAANHPKIFGAMTTAMVACTTATKMFRTPLLLAVTTLGNLGTAFKKVKGKASDFSKIFGKIKNVIKPITSAVKTVASAIGSKLAQGFSKCLPLIKNFLGVFKSVGAFLLTNPLGIAITAIVGISTALVALYKHSAKFRAFINGLVDKAKDLASGFGKWIGKACSGAKNTMSNAWDGMKKTVSNGVTAITNKNSKLHDEMISKISDATGVSKKTLNDGYKTMSDYTQTWKDLMTGKWNKLGGDIKHTANDLSSTAKDIFNGMYNKLNDLTGGGLDKIKNAWDKLWSNIINGIKSAVKSVGSNVSDMINNVIKPINSMLDGVKDGVNWVLDKFGASKWKGFKIPLVHFAKGGTVGGGTMAMVNDSGTSNYREMFATPDGRVGAFPKQRDLITYLPEGTQILDGENSKALAEMMNIPHFKDGTKDKNIFEKIFDKGKDIMEDIGDIISHPIKFMEKVLKKYLHVNTAIKFASTLISHAPSFFAKQAEKWLKKMAEDFKKSMESTGGNGVSYGSANNPGGAGVQRWKPVIIEAFKNLGQNNPPDWKVQKLLRQIATESGGNPNAHQGNIGDINNLRGTPAQGLLQFVPSTFAAWSRPGHNNIYSGLDQLMAAIYCLDHGGEGGWGNIGNGHGWENGGFVDKWSFGQIAEHNKPEVVIPLSSEKQGRALSLLTQTVNKLNRQAGINTTINTNNGSLEQKLDTMIGLLSQLITTNSNGFAKSNNGINTNGLYQQMYRDQTINNYQSI